MGVNPTKHNETFYFRVEALKLENTLELIPAFSVTTPTANSNAAALNSVEPLQSKGTYYTFT